MLAIGEMPSTWSKWRFKTTDEIVLDCLYIDKMTTLFVFKNILIRNQLHYSKSKVYCLKKYNEYTLNIENIPNFKRLYNIIYLLFPCNYQ